MAGVKVNQIAWMAVREAFANKHIFEDAFYDGDEFTQLSNDEWRDIIDELWSPELADEGGLTERAKEQERQIIETAKNAYLDKRREIKARVAELKNQIKDELEA
mgnify:CR=1 FL=1